MPVVHVEGLVRAHCASARALQTQVEEDSDPGVSGRTELTDDILLTVFRILAVSHGPEAQAASPQAAGKHFAWFRRALPLVCRRWSALLGRGGKYGWDSVVVSVEGEVAQRRRRPDSALGASPGSGTGSSSSVPGSSPTMASSLLMYSRTSLGALATLRAGGVVAWADARAGSMQHLLLDFGSASHDFSGHALEALLRAANRGPRGLRTLRLIGAAGVGGQDSYEVLARLRGLAELHVSGLPQGFLAGTLPYLTALSGLTRLSFTPEAFQFPVTVPTLPRGLRSLTLSQLWLSQLPPLPACAPALSHLELRSCFLVDGVLGSLGGATCLATLALDGSNLTSRQANERLGWESPQQWPQQPCPALTRLSLAGCGLRRLPGPALLRYAPALAHLDLSNNPDLGGSAANAADGAAAAASAACLPPELGQLPHLSTVRLAGCGLTALPSALLACPALTDLDLSSNSLSALPLAAPAAAASAAAASPARLGGGGLNGQHGGGHGSAAAAAGGGGAGGRGGGGGGGGRVAVPGAAEAAAFAERLVRLNIATNRFTVWPQGLAAAAGLCHLVLGSPLLGRAGEGELERCVASLPRLVRLEVVGSAFEPRAVRALLAVQRLAAAAGGRPVIEVTGPPAP